MNYLKIFNLKQEVNLEKVICLSHGLFWLAQGAVVQPPGLFLGVEGLGEMIRRGVGGVPGPRLVENANQFECRHAVHTKSMNERDLVVLILVNGHL